LSFVESYDQPFYTAILQGEGMKLHFMPNCYITERYAVDDNH
jgi:hypothetical protein